MSGGLVISGARVVGAEGLIEDGLVACADEHITGLGRRGELATPPDARVVAAAGMTVAAGLIDVQLNGGFGHDFTDDPARIWSVGARLPEHGVTAFLPTIVSSAPETVARAQDVLAAGPPAGYRGAAPLGLHLEGPFINPAAAGAHDHRHLRLPDPGEAAAWAPESGVRMVTLAPELPGALELVRALAGRGVVVSAGHSTAIYEEGVDGVEAGIRYATHLLNAMPQLDRRAPGLAGALLDDRRVTIGVIPDGLHLHPALLRLVAGVAGAGRLSAVTDATAALGMPDGAYTLAGAPAILDEGSVRRPDGTLAGSALPAVEGVRRLATITGRPIETALASMTSVPARLLGISAERGRLAVGARADLVLLSPVLEVVATFVGGKEVFATWA